jgi:PHD/YefM family antitoxin component YafN of YafNO toxin-antitoxin module
MKSATPKFIVGSNGRKEAVLLDIGEYRRIIDELEDLQDALTLDRAERSSRKLVPYSAARSRLKRADKL